MSRLAAVAALVWIAAGCGDDDPAPADAAPPQGFVLVGTSDLGGRGMNAALAVAGDTVYVGSRIDNVPIAIVDVSDPAAPSVVGEIGLPEEGLPGMSSRELRAVPELDLLVVLNIDCSPDLHGCEDPGAGGERENLRFYDISDRHAPTFLAKHEFTSVIISPRSPHEFFLWRDPRDGDRVLLFLSRPPFSPSFEVLDVSDPAAPVRVIAWDPIRDGNIVGPITSENILHSVSASDDGRTVYLSHQNGGLGLIDLSEVIKGVLEPAITMLTPTEGLADWAPPQPVGPHSAVPVPGRDLLVVTDEVYPEPFGTGCPYGWMRVVDVSDPAALQIVGEYQVAENDPSSCPGGERETFTAHNATVTEHLALVSWHSAGLQAIDITDAANPVGVAAYLPTPIEGVDTEDPGLGGNPVLMWSYPVVQDGLIYVIDIRNGLFILRYQGVYEEELAGAGFREGNSNL